jgi:hypothetical protein
MREGDVYCGFRTGSVWKKPVVAEEGRGGGLNFAHDQWDMLIR